MEKFRRTAREQFLDYRAHEISGNVSREDFEYWIRNGFFPPEKQDLKRIEFDLNKIAEYRSMGVGW